MEQNLAKTADIAGQHFDFVIIDKKLTSVIKCGGTAGLALASRLSENTDVSVVVLEAGKAHFGDKLITSAMGWFRQYMNPEYDWAFLTAPQVNADGKPSLWFRGKGLGDSSAMNFCMWTVHPFSRGTIHIDSADPKASPAIDPKYLSEDTDLDILVEAWKFGRKAAHTAPFKDAMVAEAVPGLQVSTEEQIREHVKNTVFTVWYTCGSVSMLPKDKGGVVDPSLKVYGTKNLRVVDYSIVPLSISSHCQATVYAIAERAADIIKADHLKV